MNFRVILTWRGTTSEVRLGVKDPTLGELGRAVEAQLGTSFETVKLLVPGRKGQISPIQNPEQHASEAGLATGCKALLLASRTEEVAQVRASRDLSGVCGFEDELKRAARRRRTATSAAAAQPPRGDFTFGSYEAWQRPGLHPPPIEALKLLYRLASDPGIRGVMEAHHYSVGLLSEMPPEGKVGISPLCILGVNINAGQEISLRLRTDDLKGFRKYERIRETLIHELAHMEFGDHDNNFKQLNSLLAQECATINARYAGGHSLLDDAGLAGRPFNDQLRHSELDGVLLCDEGDVMAATARLSGKTLLQLASMDGPVSGPPVATGAVVAVAAVATGAASSTTAVVAGPTTAAAAEGSAAVFGQLLAPRASAASAAILRSQMPTAPGRTSCTAIGGANDSTEGNGRPAGHEVTAGSDGGDSGAASNSESECGLGEEARQYEHFDAATEAAEELARRLTEAAPDERTADGDSGGGDGHEGGGGKVINGERPGASSCPPPAGGLTSTPELLGALSKTEPVPDNDAVTARNPLPAVACGVMDMDLPLSLAVSAAAPCEMAAVEEGTPRAAPAGNGAIATNIATSKVPDGDGSTFTANAEMADVPESALLAQVQGVQQHQRQPKGQQPRPRLTLKLEVPADVDAPDSSVEAALAAAGTDTMGIVRDKARLAWQALSKLVRSSAPDGAAPVRALPCHVAPAAETAQSAAKAHEPAVTGEDVMTALETLETLLGNAAHCPSEERYRRVRVGNGAFQRRVGRLPGGLDLLRVAGFTDEGAGADAVLRLRRNDPGLLWLVLSTVREAKEQVAAQMGFGTRR